jgi:hypothetical protein
MSGFAQIFALIVARDAGVDAPSIAKALLNAGGRRPPPPSLGQIFLPKPESSSVVADVAADGSVTLLVGDASVIASVPTAQLAALVSSRDDLRGHPFTITASPGVEYRLMISAIDAIREGGAPDIRFGAPR